MRPSQMFRTLREPKVPGFARLGRAVATTAIVATFSVAMVGVSAANGSPKPDYRPSASADGSKDYGGPVVSPVKGQPAASASVPKVVGPISNPNLHAEPDGFKGAIFGLSAKVLESADYGQKEFFVSGTASAFDFAGTASADGSWSVTPVSTAPYTTRARVWAPKHASRFSGRVIVEWLNVSAGLDSTSALGWLFPDVARNGDILVGLTTQFVGVASGKLNDPGRYGSLSHPGDSYSYDIFSQGGMAVRAEYKKLLGGLVPKLIIATGQSQSASRLVTYIDALAAIHHVYDAYMVQSRGLTGAPLKQAPGTANVVVDGVSTVVDNGNTGLSQTLAPTAARVRTDLLAPVLTYETESDVFATSAGVPKFGPATQEDSAGFRLWEAAGTAHGDDCFFNCRRVEGGNLPIAQMNFEHMLHPRAALPAVGLTCSAPINAGQLMYTVTGAYEQLMRWAATGGANGGIEAASVPLFAGQSVGQTVTPAPQRDANGNIIGGLRSPAVDAPVATFTGQGIPSSCDLEGTTTPFTGDQIQSLYRSHADFVSKWTKSVKQSVAGGFITKGDGRLLVRVADESTVGY